MIVCFARLGILIALMLGATADAAIINGRAYTAMSDWARASGFRLQSRRGETVSYTNRSQCRLVFEKDSTVASINGINVALSYPAALEKGELLISQLDLARTVSPLIFQPGPQRKITTICLDPGHGGKDPGNRSGSRYEKTYALLLASEVRNQLKKAGFTVIMTRTADKFLELEERPDIANRKKADLFISIHFNGTATSRSDVRGVETYCITPVGASSSNAEGRGASYPATPANAVEKQSLALAYQVQKALVNTLGAPDRSVRRARFAVLRDAKMPAILVESGYMTHPVESAKIFDPAYRQQMAAAIVKGVVNYQKLGSPSPPAPAPAKLSGNRRN